MATKKKPAAKAKAPAKKAPAAKKTPSFKNDQKTAKVPAARRGLWLGQPRKSA